MGHTGPSQVVSAPMAVPAPYGLIESGIEPDPAELADTHWQNGITYRPEGCIEGFTVDPCNPGTVEYPDNPPTVDWYPYGLIVAESCTTFSYREDRVARVTRLLRADQERQLGKEFWRGALAQAHNAAETDPDKDWPNTWLSDDTDINYKQLSASAVAPVDALACIHGYLGSHNSGSQGMIHMSPHAFTYFGQNNMLVERDGVWQTHRGDIVVASPGYDGSDPDGNVGDNNVWIYATDLVRVWLGPVQEFDTSESTDRAENDMSTQAQRVGLAEFEKCRHAGIPLAIPFCEFEAS